MLKFLKWLIEGRPHVTYEGYHCGCCGGWEDEEFSIPTYKSYGKWADTWGLCSKCIESGKEENQMDEKRAKEILGDNINSPDGGLYSLKEYIHWNVGDKKAILDGHFTADELEATAWWMRKGSSLVKKENNRGI